MSFVGIAVRVKDGKPHLRGVVLDGSTPPGVATFDYLPPTGMDSVNMIHTLAEGLHGRLSTISSTVDRIVVRQADDGARGGLTKERMLRTRAEGAALYVGRQFCADVQVLNGPAIGRALGTDLSAAEDQASQIAAAAWKVAASAALAARAL